MAEEIGRIAFFDVKRAGFYSFNDNDEAIDGDMDVILSALGNWVSDRSFENTLPCEDDNRLRKKVYCRGLYKCPRTGDYLIVLWKSESDGNGNILGVAANSSVKSASKAVITLPEEAPDGVKHIWGKPCYYWYITSINKFASIRFPHSNADTYLFGRYLRDFANFRYVYPGRKCAEVIHPNPGADKDRVYYKVTFAGEDGLSRALFRFDYELFMRRSGREFLKNARQNITHVVIRDTIGAVVADERAWWVQAFDKLPFVRDERPELKQEKQIELIVGGSPSVKEIDELFDFYEQGYAAGSTWNNIGFKQEGKSGQTKWLNEYVLREEISIPYTIAKNEHFSAEELYEFIDIKRNEFISSINLKHKEQEVAGHEADINVQEAANNGVDADIQEVARDAVNINILGVAGAN
ncbi:Uncharacterised protein [Yersinia intermedia]|uniref:hypothetical protein n=1 Tax=Yersinia intermedia TaxID=631 RepID=UPI0005E11431|nr:hypothetical protein [Yersinia intermedia]CQJ66101.1 Uncharacterised protein [Yersinia intermedia]